MHINTDMGISACSTADSASAYATEHDMAPYNAQVSSFTLPTSSGTLLTPTSISGSPSSRQLSFFNAQQSQHRNQHQQQQNKNQLQHQHQNQHQQPYNRKAQLSLPAASLTAKPDNPAKPVLLNHSPLMSHTAHHQYSPHQQQPTPPSSGGVAYGYDSTPEVSNIAQGHTPGPTYDMNGYPYQPVVKDEAIPTTMDGYFPAYTTAAPHADDATASPPMYSFSSIQNSSQYMPPQQRLPPPNGQHYSPYGAPPQTQPHHGYSHHHHQHPQGLAPLMDHQRRSLTNEYPGTVQIPPMLQGAQNSDEPAPLGGHHMSPSNSAASGEIIHTPRSSVATGHIDNVNHQLQPNNVVNGAPPYASAEFRRVISPESESKIIASGDHIEMNNDAPPEVKWIFDKHRELSQRKGKGMWEAVVAEHTNAFPGVEHATARLQMSLTRGIRKFGKFPKKEIDKFLAMYEYQEKSKYGRYAAILNGNYDKFIKDEKVEKVDKKDKSEVEWKPPLVEALAVRFGFEELPPDSNTQFRQRRNVQARKRQQSQAVSRQQAQAQASTVASSWDNNEFIAGPQQLPLPNLNQPQTVPRYAYETSFTEAQNNILADSLAARHGDNDFQDDNVYTSHSNSPVDLAMANGGSGYRQLPAPSSGGPSYYRNR